MSNLTTFFAPIPWTTVKDGGGIIIRDANGKLVADCFNSISTVEQMENKADLIVAAVNALHAIAPGREMQAAEALPELIAAAWELTHNNSSAAYLNAFRALEESLTCMLGEVQR